MKATKAEIKKDIRYLSLLAQKYPNIQAACTEIINLQAILNLPKGTEHFMSDIHGEADAFLHILNNASGVIKEKIDKVYSNTMGAEERKSLAALIYYPERKLDEIKNSDIDKADWYRVTLHRLIEVCVAITSKYSRSKVRKALPKDFEYIIDELLNANDYDHNKEQYYENIIATIIDVGRSEAFIIALANLIKRMAVDRLHIVGDIFDRGPHPDIILDRLCRHHSVDIEWGNHDVLWMGAAAGSAVCVATVLNNSMQYNNLDIIENAYGINLVPLAMFATETYEDASLFAPKNADKAQFRPKDYQLISKMHKAIVAIQFKLECQLVNRRPEFNMTDRAMLEKVDFESMTVTIDGKAYPLKDTDFPTVDPANPSRLTGEEQAVMDALVSSFMNSEKLQRHIRFLYTEGSVYRCFNGNLLFHGCIPSLEDGSFISFRYEDRDMAGKEFLDYADAVARQGYYAREGTPERAFGRDFLWFLWCGRNSPIFGRDHIATFERTLIADEATWAEPKNPYYTLYNSEDYCSKILLEFGLTSPDSHIINGHVPVKVKEGEGPVKAGGKLIVIDGGFCQAYQKYTGIAGYTMFFSSHGIRVSAHQPFEGRGKAIRYNKDIESTTVITQNLPERLFVGQTDDGKNIKQTIEDLKALLSAYRLGLLKEKKTRKSY
ncbi:MAG: fructose-1,6-bisphosphatase [Christensenellaceae bacterium]|nr:fructose-1,6-bisphosphatase [Christensenellaceae bacterium]